MKPGRLRTALGMSLAFVGAVLAFYLTTLAGRRSAALRWDGIRELLSLAIYVGVLLGIGLAGLAGARAANSTVRTIRARSVKRIVRKIEAREPGELSFADEDQAGELSYPLESGALGLASSARTPATDRKRSR